MAYVVCELYTLQEIRTSRPQSHRTQKQPFTQHAEHPAIGECKWGTHWCEEENSHIHTAPSKIKWLKHKFAGNSAYASCVNGPQVWGCYFYQKTPLARPKSINTPPCMVGRVMLGGYFDATLFCFSSLQILHRHRKHLFIIQGKQTLFPGAFVLRGTDFHRTTSALFLKACFTTRDIRLTFPPR